MVPPARLRMVETAHDDHVLPGILCEAAIGWRRPGEVDGGRGRGGDRVVRKPPLGLAA